MLYTALKFIPEERGSSLLVETNDMRHLTKALTLRFSVLSMRGWDRRKTNLVVVVFEVEVGTRELGLDDLPEPVHW